MNDKVARASAFDNTVRAFAVDIKNTLKVAMEYHRLNPLAATALGRALAAVAMMREMNKGENETVTLRINSDGPMGGLIAVGSSDGTLKGYVTNNDLLTYGDDASFGVGACLTPGIMTVIRDLGLKEPYSGTIPLQSGEIGDDLAYYYTYSEQVPSLVALGVKLNKNGLVKSASGIIIQMMPGADSNATASIEGKLREVSSASGLIEKTKTPEEMLRFMLADGKPKITDTKVVAYKCGCSKDAMLKGILSLGRDEINKIIDEQDEVETVCHYCEKRYKFRSSEIKTMLLN